MRGVRSLRKSRMLGYVELVGTGATMDAVRGLQAALPACKVEFSAE